MSLFQLCAQAVETQPPRFEILGMQGEHVLLPPQFGPLGIPLTFPAAPLFLKALPILRESILRCEAGLGEVFLLAFERFLPFVEESPETVQLVQSQQALLLDLFEPGAALLHVAVEFVLSRFEFTARLLQMILLEADAALLQDALLLEFILLLFAECGRFGLRTADFIETVCALDLDFFPGLLAVPLKLLPLLLQLFAGGRDLGFKFLAPLLQVAELPDTELGKGLLGALIFGFELFLPLLCFESQLLAAGGEFFGNPLPLEIECLSFLFELVADPQGFEPPLLGFLLGLRAGEFPFDAALFPLGNGRLAFAKLVFEMLVPEPDAAAFLVELGELAVEPLLAAVDLCVLAAEMLGDLARLQQQKLIADSLRGGEWSSCGRCL